MLLIDHIMLMLKAIEVHYILYCMNRSLGMLRCSADVE